MLVLLECVYSAQYEFFLYFLDVLVSRYMLRYLMNDRKMISLVPVITGITFVFKFQIHCIYAGRSLYFKIFQLFLSCLYLLKFQYLLTDMFVCSFISH